MIPTALALALSLLSAAPQDSVAREADDPTGLFIGKISARLWYEGTGRLSDDVLTDGFTLWNTIIGEGGAEEPASDVLVAVKVSSQDGERFVTIPLVVELVGEDGAVIQSQTTEALLTSRQGDSVQAFLFKDATCLGEVQIRATLGAEVLSEPVVFACGE